MSPRYDLVVIGSGPAGEKGAARAAYFGKRVAIVERGPHLGGAGVNTGTIPSKTLRETALYFSGLRQRGLYGIDYSLREGVTVVEFMHREHAVVETEWALIERNLKRHGIDVTWGEAAFTAPDRLSVRLNAGGSVELSADAFLIATGSIPHHPPQVPFDEDLVFDSDTILRMKRLPKSIAVVGGGIIGCEYAALFTALGIEVTQIVSSPQLLAFLDFEIRDRLQQHLQAIGLRFIFNERVAAVRALDGHVDLTLASGAGLQTEIVLYAAGRRGNVAGLGLDRAGVALNGEGHIVVDERFRTTAPGIYAAGDVIGFPALASVSMEQGRAAVTHAFSLPSTDRVSSVCPMAVYSIPEVATVGLSEDECKAKGIPYLVGRSYYDKSPRGQIIGDTVGMLKLVFSPEDKRLLGAHHIGELASELVHIGAHVMAENGTIDAFIDAVYNYPSLADSYKYAAYDGLGAHDRWLDARAAGLDAPPNVEDRPFPSVRPGVSAPGD